MRKTKFLSPKPAQNLIFCPVVPAEQHLAYKVCTKLNSQPRSVRKTVLWSQRMRKKKIFSTKIYVEHFFLSRRKRRTIFTFQRMHKIEHFTSERAQNSILATENAQNNIFCLQKPAQNIIFCPAMKENL